jgi:hypothetical protein
LIPGGFPTKATKEIWPSNSSNLIFCTYKVKTEKGRSLSGLLHFQALHFWPFLAGVGENALRPLAVASDQFADLT